MLFSKIKMGLAQQERLQGVGGGERKLLIFQESVRFYIHPLHLDREKERELHTEVTFTLILDHKQYFFF